MVEKCTYQSELCINYKINREFVKFFIGTYKSIFPIFREFRKFLFCSWGIF